MKIGSGMITVGLIISYSLAPQPMRTYLLSMRLSCPSLQPIMNRFRSSRVSLTGLGHLWHQSLHLCLSCIKVLGLLLAPQGKLPYPFPEIIRLTLWLTAMTMVLACLKCAISL